jgi:hypothetical protein
MKLCDICRNRSDVDDIEIEDSHHSFNSSSDGENTDIELAMHKIKNMLFKDNVSSSDD